MASNSRLAVTLLTTGVALAIAGCQSTPTATTAVTTAPTRMTTASATSGMRWGGPGVYSVGEQPSGGALASIPAGRYRVQLEDGSTFGAWYRCSALPCSPTSPTIIDSGAANGPGYSTIVDVLSADGGVYIDGVVFIQVK